MTGWISDDKERVSEKEKVVELENLGTGWSDGGEAKKNLLSFRMEPSRP